MTNKELVIRKVRELPDNASLDDIAEEIAILAAIREGEREVAKGRFFPHEEVKRQVKEWFSN